MGAAFAFGWTPCIGPFLTAALALGAASDTVARGMVVLTFYSLGLGIPFLVTSVAIAGAYRSFDRLRPFLVPDHGGVRRPARRVRAPPGHRERHRAQLVVQPVADPPRPRRHGRRMTGAATTWRGGADSYGDVTGEYLALTHRRRSRRRLARPGVGARAGRGAVPRRVAQPGGRAHGTGERGSIAPAVAAGQVARSSSPATRRRRGRPAHRCRPRGHRRGGPPPVQDPGRCRHRA